MAKNKRPTSSQFSGQMKPIRKQTRQEPGLPPLIFAHYRKLGRLQPAIRAKIGHFMRCKDLLYRVDPEVWAAGLECFESYDNFALWLCAPQVGLGGKAPLIAMVNAAGRRQVIQMLNVISDRTNL